MSSIVILLSGGAFGCRAVPEGLRWGGCSSGRRSAGLLVLMIDELLGRLLRVRLLLLLRL